MPLSQKEKDELELLQLEDEEHNYKTQITPKSDKPILNRLKDSALSGLQYAGEKIDQYAGAPSRRGLMNALEGEGLGGYVGGFKEQFGKNPAIAPTEAEIGQKLGFSGKALSDVLPQLYSESGEGLPLKKGGLLDPTAKGVAGFVASAATDPTSYLPVGEIAKLGVKRASKVISPLAKVARASGGLLKEGAIKGTAAVGSAVSGVPRDLVENYMRRTDQINHLVGQYGNDLASASDDVRKAFQTKIRNTRQGLNQVITDTLKKDAVDTVGPKRIISVSPILDSLEESKSKLNKVLDKDQINQVNELIGTVKELAPEGHVDPTSFYQLSQHLNEVSSGAYQKAGQIFMPGKAVQRAAKFATKETREIIKNDLPEIAQANNAMAKLHRVEELINKNLIAPGKPEGALMAAGSSPNRGRKFLEELGKLTDTDMVSRAKDLATQKEFTRPGLLPSGPQTGYAVLRPILASALGSAAAGPVGLAAAVFTSPMVLKAAINAGKVPIDVIHALVGKTGALTDSMINQAVKVANSPHGNQIIKGAYMAGMGNVRRGEQRE